MGYFSSKELRGAKISSRTPDFDSMIRITFWNGLGFIFFMFIKSYVVIYYFEGSGLDLGIIMALQPLARLFSMPLIAYLTDHTSKKRLVLIGSAGRTLAYFLYWFSLVINNLYLFGVGTFLQGLLVGFFWPPFLSLISEKSNKANRTHAIALGRGKMIGYGFLIGALISIPIFAFFNFYMPDNIALVYSPLLIFSAINLVAGHRFYRKVDESLTYEKFLMENKQDHSEFSERLKGADNSIMKSRINLTGFTCLILAIFITSMTGTIYSPFIAAYLIENLLIGLSEGIVPIIVMIVYFPAQVLSQLLAAKIGNVFDRISSYSSVILLNSLKALLIWWLIITISPFDFAFVLILLYLMLVSNNYFIQAIMSRISVKHRGKMFGLNIWIDQLGRVVGPIIGGLLWDSLSYVAPFVISIFIIIAVIPIYIFAIEKLKDSMVESIDKK